MTRPGKRGITLHFTERFSLALELAFSFKKPEPAINKWLPMTPPGIKNFYEEENLCASSSS